MPDDRLAITRDPRVHLQRSHSRLERMRERRKRAARVVRSCSSLARWNWGSPLDELSPRSTMTLKVKEPVWRISAERASIEMGDALCVSWQRLLSRSSGSREGCESQESERSGGGEHGCGRVREEEQGNWDAQRRRKRCPHEGRTWCRLIGLACCCQHDGSAKLCAARRECVT